MSDNSAPELPKIADLLAQHRPYGLDCKCGRPINSDADWAKHFIEVMELTEEWGVLSPGEVEPNGIFDFPEPPEKIAAARISHGTPADVASRLVSPWRADGEG